jgi:hypothetical protein
LTTTMSVRERPILFSGEMVRAILDGRKTQTRRVVKPQPTKFPSHDEPGPFVWFPVRFRGLSEEGRIRLSEFAEKLRPFCPYGQPGDRLWVREGFIRHISIPQLVGYVADGCEVTEHWERRAPSIHMPRHFSRLTLEITEVRVEPLQEITGAGAKAEGVANPVNPFAFSEHLAAFQQLWDRLNGPRSYGWDANPWVWVVSFRKVEASHG